MPDAGDQAERHWWEEDEDRNNTAGNTFCVDHRAALQILLREIEKGTCFSQFSSETGQLSSNKKDWVQVSEKEFPGRETTQRRRV